jgi:uncharacterized protein (TIGR03089 family)
MTTLGALLSAVPGPDPASPLLTYYDDGTAERTELSGATLANWVAKTANLLVDGVATEPGEVCLIALPAHWQTAAVLLGAWSAGLQVTTVPFPSGVSVAFVDAGTATTGELAAVVGERYALGLHPLGLPLREVPTGYLDYNAEVRGYGDRFTPVVPIGEDAPAIPGSSRGELFTQAAVRAEELGIKAGDRVLVDAGAYPQFLDWLLAPLAANASIVLCRHLDPARRAARIAAERVTLTLTLTGR